MRQILRSLQRLGKVFENRAQRSALLGGANRLDIHLAKHRLVRRKRLCDRLTGLDPRGDIEHHASQRRRRLLVPDRAQPFAHRDASGDEHTQLMREVRDVARSHSLVHEPP